MKKSVGSDLQNLLYRQQRFVLIPGCITNTVVRRCLALVSDLNQPKWRNGDNSSHSWKELSGPSLVELNTIVPSHRLEAILHRKLRASFQWLNVYSGCQFIPGHRDAGGDAHLLACISVPRPDEGGQFWLDRKNRIIPLGVGDVLLFEANNLLHGTTPMSLDCNTKRVTLSTRLWLAN